MSQGGIGRGITRLVTLRHNGGSVVGSPANRNARDSWSELLGSDGRDRDGDNNIPDPVV